MSFATSMAAAVSVAVLVAGCGPSGGGGAGPSPSGLTEPVAPAGKSVFDPCRDIDDETVRAAGFNPATREPSQANGEYTASCRFSSADMSLVVSTSKTSFEEFRDRYLGLREGLDIGRRPAVVVRKPQPEVPCELAMKTTDGIVTLQTALNVTAKQWGTNRCARIVDIATVVEPAIDAS